MRPIKNTTKLPTSKLKTSKLKTKKLQPHLLLAGTGYLGLEIAYQAAEHFHLSTLNRTGELATHAGDLTSTDDLRAIKNDIPPVDVIIHCASSSRGGPEAYQAVFIEGCQALREVFPDAHLILTSSSSVYGQIDGSEVNENSETNPSTETSRLLLRAEKIAHTAARLSGIYGPGRSVILKKFLANEAIIEDDGRRILNQIHRDDAASALVHLALKKTPGIFNLSDNEPLSQLKTYQALAKMLSRPLPPYGDRPKERKRAWTHKKVLNHKLRASGWKPRFPSFLDAVPKLLKHKDE